MEKWKIDKNAADRANEAVIRDRVRQMEHDADTRAVAKTVIDPKNRGSIRRTKITEKK